MLLGDAENRRRIEMRQAIARRHRNAQHAGHRFERLPGSLSSPAPWTCEWLDDTCSVRVVPGTWQTKDENRTLGAGARPAQAGK